MKVAGRSHSATQFSSARWCWWKNFSVPFQKVLTTQHFFPSFAQRTSRRKGLEGGRGGKEKTSTLEQIIETANDTHTRTHEHVFSSMKIFVSVVSVFTRVPKQQLPKKMFLSVPTKTFSLRFFSFQLE